MPLYNYSTSDEEKAVAMDAAQGVLQSSDNTMSLPTPIRGLEEDEIFEAATDYLSWKYRDFTLKGLPAFDKSDYFGIQLEDENKNIKEEIKSFIKFLSSDKPPLFDSCGALDATNEAGFEDLSNVVDQIRCNFEIIRHDNASLSLGNYVRETFYDVFKNSRKYVRQRYVGKSGRITGHTPRRLEDETKNNQAYHALVDFILQSMAWWLIHVAERPSWRVPIIAVLARWSVKLKLIALDPVRWAEASLIRGEDTMRRIANDQKDENRVMVKFLSTNLETETKSVDFPQDLDMDYFYFLWKFRIRENLIKFFDQILGNLVAEKSGSTRYTAFEIRTLIYQGALDKTLRHITTRRSGSIEISSDSTNLKRSYLALQLLFSNVERIDENKTPKPSAELATFDWYIKPAKGLRPKTKAVTTARIDDVVSALVPLGIVGCSNLFNQLKNMLRQQYFDEGRPQLLPDLAALGDSPRIEFSLSTQQERLGQIGQVGMHMIPSSKSPLVMSMEDTDNGLGEHGAGDEDIAEMDLKKKTREILDDYHFKTAEFKSWTPGEDSILVFTYKYTAAVLTVAVAIIGSSLAAPFLAKDSITAVDPFNFVTFGWLVVGAFLVVAKSRYAENWPWHDFLRGQVVCRSVSELHKASKVDEQTVLLYLLHHEFKNPTTFRGPYHGLFRRHADKGTQGFNVNVPTEYKTVLAAGFIVLQVFDEEVDTGEMDPKIYTQLHDTRNDAQVTADQRPRLFDSVEDMADGVDNNAQGKSGARLKASEDSDVSTSQFEVLGIPTGDYKFV